MKVGRHGMRGSARIRPTPHRGIAHPLPFAAPGGPAPRRIGQPLTWNTARRPRSAPRRNAAWTAAVPPIPPARTSSSRATLRFTGQVLLGAGQMRRPVRIVMWWGSVHSQPAGSVLIDPAPARIDGILWSGLTLMMNATRRPRSHCRPLHPHQRTTCPPPRERRRAGETVARPAHLGRSFQRPRYDIRSTLSSSRTAMNSAILPKFSVMHPGRPAPTYGPGRTDR